MIADEFSKENQANADIKFQEIGKIKLENLDAAFIGQMKDHVSQLNSYYIKKYNNASTQKDRKIAEMNSTPEKKEEFMKLKNDYENESLADLVRNSNELDKILEKDGKLIQRADPVFCDPTGSNYGRAHFFAPRKKFFGSYIDTYWFNMSVIWLMSVIMTITLYFDVLRKIIDGLGELIERISGKKS